MICFSTHDLMDENKCYERLVEILHPNGMCCPVCGKPVEQCKVHRRNRAPVLAFRCDCSRVFNAFTGTVWQGTHHDCRTILLILQGIAQGKPTLQVAQELNIDRKHLLKRRHRIQALAERACSWHTLTDDVIEVDKMYQNAGKKGQPHLDPEDPLRCRANQARGHGTWDNDRHPCSALWGEKPGRSN